MSNFFVSIIIPTFNRADIISETLNSILMQTYKNWECIIIDDGSDDNSDIVISEFVKLDSRFKYYNRPKEYKSGGCGARNYGLEISTGDFINWFDSDDLMMPNHIQSHLEEHMSNSNIDMSVSNAVIFDTHQLVSGNWSNIKPKKDVINEMIIDDTLWPTNCVMWRKEVLNSNPFNESLSCSQEWTFHLEMVLLKMNYCIMDITTVKVRKHDNRIGGTISVNKNDSIFRSRLLIMNNLKEKGILNKFNELGLLKQMFSALKSSIDYKYYKLFFRIYGKLFSNVFSFINYRKVSKVLLISVPVYLVLKKGEKLFKV